ncbi:MAG: hypothetical protein GKR90_04150 [Pseudomonadales bacterium]|nr:hypothetical protein [Pseudomonadales bacterium]
MGWLIAVFVVAMVVGPIMYLKPSEKDKRLSALRLAARNAGLTVKLAAIPRLDPEASDRVSAGGELKQPELSCAAYQLNFDTEVDVSVDVRLLRIPKNPTIPVTEAFSGWMVDPGSTEGWQSIAPKVKTVLNQISAGAPDFCIALAVDARFLSCYWLERAPADGPQIAELRDFLRDAQRQVLMAIG